MVYEKWTNHDFNKQNQPRLVLWPELDLPSHAYRSREFSTITKQSSSDSVVYWTQCETEPLTQPTNTPSYLCAVITGRFKYRGIPSQSRSPWELLRPWDGKLRSQVQLVRQTSASSTY